MASVLLQIMEVSPTPEHAKKQIDLWFKLGRPLDFKPQPPSIVVKKPSRHPKKMEEIIKRVVHRPQTSKIQPAASSRQTAPKVKPTSTVTHSTPISDKPLHLDNSRVVGITPINVATAVAGTQATPIATPQQQQQQQQQRISVITYAPQPADTVTQQRETKHTVCAKCNA
jgi:hypothetical protein